MVGKKCGEPYTNKKLNLCRLPTEGTPDINGKEENWELGKSGPREVEKGPLGESRSRLEL